MDDEPPDNLIVPPQFRIKPARRNVFGDRGISKGPPYDVQMVPSVHQTVSDVYEILNTEIRLVLQAQRSGVRLDNKEALRLQRMVMTLREAQRTQAEALDMDDPKKWSDEKLLLELRAELEKVRADE
jgi:hypothetical protein